MYEALVKRHSQLKPTRAKFTTSTDLGIVWPPTWLELDGAGLNLIKLKSSPNSRQVFHRSAISANSTNSRQVVLLLCEYAVVFRQLNGFLQAGLTWRYRLATRRCKFWFVTWFGLAVLCVARAKTFAVDRGSWGVGCSITRWLLLHPPRPFQEANTIDDSDASLASRTDANKRSGVYSKLLADQLFRARRRYEDLLRKTFNADQDSRNWQHARHLHGRFFMERCQLCLVLGSWGACVIFFLRSLPGAVDSPVIVWHVNLSSVVALLSQ